MDNKLQKDIDEQRVYLVGCEKMIPPASRHCFYCNQDVYYSFLPVDEAETTCVEFKISSRLSKNHCREERKSIHRNLY